MIINGTNYNQITNKDKEKKINISSFSELDKIEINQPDNLNEREC